MGRDVDASTARKVRKDLSARFPDWYSILAVFSVACLILYGWTILNAAWKMGSWLYNLNSWEIFSLLSYALVFDLLESMAVIIGLLILSFVLPRRLFRDEFVARGVIIILCTLGSMILHLMINGSDDSLRVNFYQSLRLWWLITFTLTALLAWFIPKISAARKVLHEFADRTMVFLFALIPFSALGLIVIIFRFFFTG